MCLVVLPVTLVSLAVDVRQCAIALLDIFHPLAVVLVAVGEDVHTLAVHLRVDPLTLVHASVRVYIAT
jgi:hypothetical protein